MQEADRSIAFELQNASIDKFMSPAQAAFSTSDARPGPGSKVCKRRSRNVRDVTPGPSIREYQGKVGNRNRKSQSFKRTNPSTPELIDIADSDDESEILITPSKNSTPEYSKQRNHSGRCRKCKSASRSPQVTSIRSPSRPPQSPAPIPQDKDVRVPKKVASTPKMPSGWKMLLATKLNSKIKWNLFVVSIVVLIYTLSFPVPDIIGNRPYENELNEALEKFRPYFPKWMRPSVLRNNFLNRTSTSIQDQKRLFNEILAHVTQKMNMNYSTSSNAQKSNSGDADSGSIIFKELIEMFG